MCKEHFKEHNKPYRVNSSCLSSSEDFLMLVSTVGPFTYSYNTQQIAKHVNQPCLHL
jgi:hypothetical protein